jgi:predicted kinase
LVAFAGEAGSGKSALSRALGRRLRWPVIDKDDMRDLLDEANPGLAYDIMWNVARRQLFLGLSVICDSPLTGGPWHAIQVAAQTSAALAVVECRCPDEAVWRARIDGRKALNLPSHHQTDWDTVQAHRRTHPPQSLEVIGYPYLMVDTTVAPVEALCDRLVAWLAAL